MTIRRPHHPLLSTAATLGLLATSAVPASAGPPTNDPFTMLSITCHADSELGPLELNLSHSSTGAGWPGGDIVVWAPGSDPEEDLPVLAGYEAEIDRQGPTLRGTIPLREPGGEPGHGLVDGPGTEPGDIVGHATYEVTFTPAGPSTSEVIRGPITDEAGGRTNQRYTNRRERTPVVGAGTLELPGAAPVTLDGCVGSEVDEQVTVTEPETIVTARRDPVGFECATPGHGVEVHIQVTGGEAAVVLVPAGGEDAIAFGSAFVDETRDAITTTVPMSDPDGADLGEATLHADLRVVGREVVRDAEGDATTRVHVEHLVVGGTVGFAGDTYRFGDCDTVRVREHRIDRGATHDHDAAPAASGGPRGRRP
jgi:hypothetical protein